MDTSKITEKQKYSKYENGKASSDGYYVLKRFLRDISGVCIFLLAVHNSLSYLILRLWGDPGEFWQSQWNKVVALANNDPVTLNVYGVVLWSYLFYWTVGLMYTFMDLTGWPSFLYKYKIQPWATEPLSKGRLLKVILLVHFNQLITSVVLSRILFGIFESRFQNMSTTLPNFHWVIFEIVIFIIIDEIGFYYAHRLFHHPILYKKFHKIHHEFQAPIAIMSIYAHPLEHVLANLLPIIIGTGLMGSHPATTYLWFTLVIITTLTDHSGYHLPFLLSPEFHDFHHLKFNQCFGIIGILDWFHGTDDKFRETKNFKRHNILMSLTPSRKEIPDD